MGCSDNSMSVFRTRGRSRIATRHKWCSDDDSLRSSSTLSACLGFVLVPTSTTRDRAYMLSTRSCLGGSYDAATSPCIFDAAVLIKPRFEDAVFEARLFAIDLSST
jgi:hypothetical protein